MLKDGQFALSQLPKKFHHALNNSEALSMFTPLAGYISRKYSKYGYKQAKALSYGPESKPTDYPFDSDRYRWVEHPESGLRHVGTSSDIVNLQHTGWYVDNERRETCTGEVYQLPARNHAPQYVPAVSDPYGNDGATFDFHSIFANKKECAHCADGMAESYAEREREYKAKEYTKQRVEEIAEEITQAYKAFRDTSRILRQLPKADAKQMIAREWESTRATIEELRTERRKIEKEGMDY